MKKITYTSAKPQAQLRGFRSKQPNYIFEYKLIDSILKSHFKLLMKISADYSYKTKSGLIEEKDKDVFLALVEKIDSSNDKRCATSHKSSIEKRKQRATEPKLSECTHDDLGSLGYIHGDIVNCPMCGQRTEVW